MSGVLDVLVTTMSAPSVWAVAVIPSMCGAMRVTFVM
jgi:hypothetical protein